MTAPRWLPAAAVTVFAAALAWFNRGERVAIDLGLATFYRAPLSVILFLVFLAGMLAMLLLSLRHDRAVRDELRRHGLLQPEEPAPRAASAWGVAREPARDEVSDRAVAFTRRDENEGTDRTVAFPRADENDGPGRTVAFSRRDENEGADRTAAHPRLDENGDTERTVGFPRRDENEGTDRTVGYPRRDEDPAA